MGDRNELKVANEICGNGDEDGIEMDRVVSVTVPVVVSWLLPAFSRENDTLDIEQNEYASFKLQLNRLAPEHLPAPLHAASDLF